MEIKYRNNKCQFLCSERYSRVKQCLVLHDATPSGKSQIMLSPS